MFIEGDSVLAPKSPLHLEVERFVTAYWRKIAKEIAKGGHPDEPAMLSAQLVSATMQRSNFVRHVFRPGLTDEQFTASLTAALQLHLFPTTPVDVLTANPLDAPPGTGLPPVGGMGPLAAVPRRGEIEIVDPRDALGTQARATASQLLDAARRVINRRGFGAANIDQVVAEAGVARGTFYRYFDSLVEPLVVLGLESSRVLVEQFAVLPSVAGDPGRLRAWLHDVLALQHHYSGVMRAWSECYPVEPGLLATTSDVVVAMGRAVAEIFGPPRPYPLARRACGMLFSGLIEHFPNEAARGRVTPSAQQLVEGRGGVSSG
jgi:AcrR family transcriptional regulator